MKLIRKKQHRNYHHIIYDFLYSISFQAPYESGANEYTKLQKHHENNYNISLFAISRGDVGGRRLLHISHKRIGLYQRS